MLDVAVAGGRLKALLPASIRHKRRHSGQFVDAEVRIRGACGAVFNKKLQMVGILLYVPDLKQIEILKPPEDPFAKSVQPIETVARFAPGRSLGHRIRVQGVVTLQDAGKTHLHLRRKDRAAHRIRGAGRHSSAGIAWMWPVSRARPTTLLPSRTPSAGASGTRRHWTPIPVTVEQILSGDYDSLPVSIEGRLLGRSVLAG